MSPLSCLSPTSYSESLVINEILADPPSGADLNGDGVAKTTEDEFIELVNIGDVPLDLNKLYITVDGGTGEKPFHYFSDYCLMPRQAIVIFSGGVQPNKAPVPADFVTANGTAGLRNQGASVKLIDGSGHIYDSCTYGVEGGKDQSINRWPELSGHFVPHREIPLNVVSSYSPGTCADGRSFDTLCARSDSNPSTSMDDGNSHDPDMKTSQEDVYSEPDIFQNGGDVGSVEDSQKHSDQNDEDVPQEDCIQSYPGSLIINEFLADPPKDVDVNGDGHYGVYDDEFIEIVNGADLAVSLENVQIVVTPKDKEPRIWHAFESICLPAHHAIVVFGGGEKEKITTVIGVEILLRNGSGNLNNGNVTLALISPYTLLDIHYYGIEGSKDQSLTRSPDLLGDFILHGDIGLDPKVLFSPGTCRDGVSLFHETDGCP